MKPERAQKYGLDLERIRANAEKLSAMLRDIQGTILTAAQTKEAEFPKNDEEDAETGLYSGGFPTPADRARFKKIREASPEYLADRGTDFDDEHFDGLLLRFRARNWPEVFRTRSAKPGAPGAKRTFSKGATMRVRLRTTSKKSTASKGRSIPRTTRSAKCSKRSTPGANAWAKRCLPSKHRISYETAESDRKRSEPSSGNDRFPAGPER